MKFLKPFLANAVLVVISVALVFVGLETFLWVWGDTHQIQMAATPVVSAPSGEPDAEIPIPPDLAARAKAREELLTMPDEFKRRPANVPGAARADYWQGVLEVYNQKGMRWSAAIPAKRADVYRVMVVGDSLTYGQGIDQQWRFSDLAQRWLGQQYRIEFINMGVDGYQSEDVLQEIVKGLPEITPNLVLYAICLNDFLPSGSGQYNNRDAYPFPLPISVKTFLIQRTRSGAFLSETYDRTLRRFHLRTDFYDDILSDFRGYQVRFAHDVAKMNSLAKAAGLPPLVGMVVDQYPYYGDRGYRIAKIAEKALSDAGAVAIPMEDYYRRYSGQAMYVSRWEGHPNEIANVIWANMIVRTLRGRDDLQAFKK
jgi:hypothetical protein